MKHLKRWLALALSAALALSLLTGCCCTGGISSSALAQLLSGELKNVTVASSADFDRALKAAVQTGGADAEKVQTALAEGLSLTSAAQVDFTISALTNAAAGRQALNVVFKSGSDVNAAALGAAIDWLLVLRGLPEGGEYTAQVGAVRTEGGYILAIAVTVEQPGDLDDGPEPDPVRNLTASSFDELINHIKKYSGTLSRTTITLADSYTPSNLTQKALNDAGIQSNTLDCGGATVVLTGSKPLFDTIDGVTLSYLNLEVRGNITGFLAGSITMINNGTIQGCDVTITGSISADGNTDTYAGGIAGKNSGTIQGCNVTITGSISATGGFLAFAGGIAGLNYNNIEDCTVTGGSISATDTGGRITYAGGIAGANDGGTIQGCIVTGGSITATSKGPLSAAYAGGIVGKNGSGSVTNCRVEKVQITATGGGDQYAGAIDGNNNYDKATCTDSGVTVTTDPDDGGT